MTNDQLSSNFLASTFAHSKAPYDYMLQTGFGSPICSYPTNELDELRNLVPTLSVVHLALVFAIAEKCDPTRFAELACNFIHHHELSVRLGAFQTLVALRDENISQKLYERIITNIGQCPEGAEFLHYWFERKGLR